MLWALLSFLEGPLIKEPLLRSNFNRYLYLNHVLNGFLHACRKYFMGFCMPLNLTNGTTMHKSGWEMLQEGYCKKSFNKCCFNELLRSYFPLFGNICAAHTNIDPSMILFELSLDSKARLQQLATPRSGVSGTITSSWFWFIDACNCGCRRFSTSFSNSPCKHWRILRGYWLQ